MDTITRIPAVITVGNFDGMHRGHAAVVEAALELAREYACRCVAVTFTVSPLSILRPQAYTGSIITEQEKEALLHAAGVHDIVALEPTRQVLGQSPDAFIRSLRARYDLRGIVVGENFRFGAGAAGDTDDLRNYGQKHGIPVRVMPLLRDDTDTIISSTRIRRALSVGEMTTVTACLGREWRVSGTVLHGDARGRLLGYPTANLDAPRGRVLPPDGVYATRVTYRGTRYAAATNIGTNPTFAGCERRIEAHLLDMKADMYGAEIDIDFVAYTRPQITFSSADALRRQLASDTETVRRILQP